MINLKTILINEKYLFLGNTKNNICILYFGFNNLLICEAYSNVLKGINLNFIYISKY